MRGTHARSMATRSVRPGSGGRGTVRRVVGVVRASGAAAASGVDSKVKKASLGVGGVGGRGVGCVGAGARWVAAKGRRRQQQCISAVGGGDDEDASSSSSSTTTTTTSTTTTERPAGAEVDLGAVIGRFKEATTSPTHPTTDSQSRLHSTRLCIQASRHRRLTTVRSACAPPHCTLESNPRVTRAR